MGEDRLRAKADLEISLDERERERRLREDETRWPGKHPLVRALEQSSGTALPVDLRRTLESSLDEDLGNVRVHVDGKAAQAAQALDAKAFTIGQAVYFGAGQFDPRSVRGRQLIAHEVAHTIQQRGATGAAEAAIGRAGDGHEAQAESFADSFTRHTGPQANGRGRAVPPPTFAPVSRGSISHAVVQRDLLDGAAPAARPEPIHVAGSQPDLASQTRNALREARTNGGTPAVVQLARNLRAQATPANRAQIEQAIGEECNATEKRQLGSPQHRESDPSNAATNSAPHADVPATAAPAISANVNVGAGGGSGTTTTGAEGASGHSTTQPANANAGAAPTSADTGAGGANANVGAGGAAPASGAGGGSGANANVGSGGAAAVSAGTGGGGAPQTANANAGAGGAANGADGAGGGAQAANANAGAGGAAGASAQAANANAGAQQAPHGTTGAGGGNGATAQTGARGGSGHDEAPAHAATEGDAHAPPEAGGRALIEQELAFHEQWKAYSENGAAGRAGHLLGGMIHGEDGSVLSGDLAMGGRGALLQFGGGMAARLLATKTPLSRIPGVGNIIGGALSAYSLFSNGGAGIRSLGSEIGHGIGGAFNAQNWHDSPWLTLANLVAGIKAVLELIGNVCNILSGLAYAFAAIAAVGGLLSVLFPPLAFLVPYIPAAINFGRACGGIATICITAANILSPIPPVLRAIHLIFSTNDPIRLVGDEHKYHEEVQGALAAYGSAKMNQMAEHGVRAGATRSVTGDRLHTMGDASEAYRGSLGGGVLPTASNVRAGVANTREALGMNDTTRSGQQVGRGYFNPEEQTQRNERRLDKERDRLDREEKDNQYVQGRADRAVERRDANPTAQNVQTANTAAETAERHEAQVAHQEHRVEMVKQQTQIPSGRMGEEIGGESGDMTDNAFKRNRETSNESREVREGEEANEAYHELREGQAAPHADRNAQGHVQLPEPPGTLQQIEALDQQIEQLRHAQEQAHEQTADARTTERQAGQQAQGLTTAQQGVNAHIQQNVQRGATSQAAITGQNTDITARTTQAHGQTANSTTQASGTLTAIAGTARTVDGLLQRVPHNRFFDVSSSQRNVHNFVTGMDQVTGASAQQAQQHSQTTAAVSARTQQQQQANTLNTQATGQGQQLAATMTRDAHTAQAAQAEARALTTQGQTQQQTVAQQLATAQEQRRARWAQLLNWAAQHRALREQATAGEHHG